MSNNKLSDCLLKQIKEKEKIFYKIYNVSIVISYLSVILFGWYFVSLAYTTKTQNYNILCFNCNNYNFIITNILLYLSLFNIVFYLLNEVRFRMLEYFKFTRKLKLKTGNLIIYYFTIVIFILMILYIF